MGSNLLYCLVVIANYSLIKVVRQTWLFTFENRFYFVMTEYKNLVLKFC